MKTFKYLTLIILTILSIECPTYAHSAENSALISVSALTSTKKPEVNRHFDLYLTLTNENPSKIGNLDVQLIAPKEVMKWQIEKAWPKTLGKMQLITRKYTFLASRSGNYNIGAIMFHDGIAVEGYITPLVEVNVIRRPLIPLEGIPQSLTTIIPVLTGIIVGFLLNIFKDYFQKRTSRQDLRVTAFSKASLLLDEVVEELKDNNYPVKAINDWRRWGIDDPKSFRVLINSEKLLKHDINNQLDALNSVKGDFTSSIKDVQCLRNRLNKKKL